ncbi:MAG: PKD domain-containing protein [Prevotella sp.]|nr:PKD domain-containing protein [Prevotella sp.]
MRKLLLFLTTLIPLCSTAQGPVASFMATEATNNYYHCGFDDEDEFDTWLWSTTNVNQTYQWHIYKYAYVQHNNIPYDDYLNHNPNSKMSLLIQSSSSGYQDELGYSPAIEVLPNSTMSFWICNGPFVYEPYNHDDRENYDYTICLLDENNDSILVARGSELFYTVESLDDIYQWKHVSYDLSALAGKTVQVQLHYWGKNGDHVFIDDIEFIQTGGDAGTVDLYQGQQAHFVDYSKGDNLTYAWEFPGGTPATSTEKDPIVTYYKEGVYDVRLTVTSGSATSSSEHKAYVNVAVQTPEAHYAYPDQAYRRVAGGCFIPNNTPVTFRDASTHYPTDWLWTFNGGASTDSSTDHEPTVYFPKAGYYTFSLQASNKAGAHTADSPNRAIKVGGASAYVWNIEEDEIEKITAVKIGNGEGYFGGSNTRRMIKVAERFDKPLAEATISKVGLLFLSTTNFKPDTTIVVEIWDRDKQTGFPANVLGRSELALKNCKVAEAPFGESGLTDFTFSKPVTVNDEFFVVVSGIPAYEMDHMTKYLINEIYLGCSPLRDETRRNTTYAYIDSLAFINGMAYFTNNYIWQETSSGRISMAVAPYLSFANVSEVVQGISDMQAIRPEADEQYYDLRGHRLNARPSQGVFIVRRADGKAEKHIAK